MFFDTENCRALRVLHEISGFLEASIEKLLDLEKETLNELEKEKSDQTPEPLIDKIKEEPIENECPQKDKGTSCTAQPDREVLFSAKLGNDRTFEHFHSNSNLIPDLSNKNGQSSFEDKSNEINCEKRQLESMQLDLSEEIENDPKKVRKSANLPENVIIKKELNKSYLDTCQGSTFKVETSTIVLDDLNKSSCNKFLPEPRNTIWVKKEFKSPSKDINEISSITSTGINELIENLGKIGPRTISEEGIVFRENHFFKAKIRFRKCFSWIEVKNLLTSAGVQDIKDMAITDKNAIVTFFSNDKLQELLILNTTTGLKKIRAFSVEPCRKYNIIEGKVPFKEKNKKCVKRK